MTTTTDLVRMSAERKVADAIILERAANVLERNVEPEACHWTVQFLEGLATKLREEAETEWAGRPWPT